MEDQWTINGRSMKDEWKMADQTQVKSALRNERRIIVPGSKNDTSGEGCEKISCRSGLHPVDKNPPDSIVYATKKHAVPAASATTIKAIMAMEKITKGFLVNGKLAKIKFQVI